MDELGSENKRGVLGHTTSNSWHVIQFEIGGHDTN
jgi:hypothetical protein